MPSVTRSVTGAAVIAVFDDGLTETGEVKTKKKTLSNVKVSATDEGKYNVVEAIAGLQDLELEGIEDREYGRLTKGF